MAVLLSFFFIDIIINYNRGGYVNTNYDNREKYTKTIGILISIIIIILLFFGVLFFIKSNKTTNNKDDSELRLQDDFYAVANHDRINNMTIPSAYSSWSVFHDAQLNANIKKENLIDELINKNGYTNKNMEIMVELYKDYNTRNKLGLSELEKYFDMIDNCKTMEEFNKTLITLDHDLNANGFLSVVVNSDMYNTNKNVLTFSPIIVEDNFEAYTLSQYKKYADEYRLFRKKILKLYGWNDQEIDEFSKEVDEFVEKVQKESITLTEVKNKVDLYHKYTFEEVSKELVNLPVVNFLKRYGLENQDYYIFQDMGHYKALDKLFTIENLEFFKKYEKLLILEKVAVYYTTDDYFNLGVEVSNKLSGNNISSSSKKAEYISNIKEASLGSELAKTYEERYFTEEDKKFVVELVNEIKEYYKDVIQNSWLEPSTKEEALKKLNSMKVNVGYIDRNKNIPEAKLVSKSNGGTLISNYILSNRNGFDRIVDELNMSSDGSISFDTFQVNAFYNHLDNSINFTAAYKELYVDEKDYYKILGYVGTVIGHEISHAFDYTGSEFDETGNVRKWWTEKDKAKYEELSKKIIEYYNGYKIGNYNVNGVTTLSENIADLASMKCMMTLLEKKNATKEDYQHFFEAYADLWASKETDAAIENDILTDNHSPNKVRVNAVLSSTDKFYEIYDIKEDDKMYVKKEDRVGLW
jgi:putative endopeptidase